MNAGFLNHQNVSLDAEVFLLGQLKPPAVPHGEVGRRIPYFFLGSSQQGPKSFGLLFGFQQFHGQWRKKNQEFLWSRIVKCVSLYFIIFFPFNTFGLMSTQICISASSGVLLRFWFGVSRHRHKNLFQSTYQSAVGQPSSIWSQHCPPVFQFWRFSPLRMVNNAAATTSRYCILSLCFWIRIFRCE